MKFKHVKPDDIILTRNTEPFSFSDPPIDPIELAKDLYETLMETKYLGLSAPQVGLPYRVFALRTTPGIVCFNPKIVDRSNEELLLDEMSMTHEHLIVPVKRPKKIKVRFTLPNGEVKTEVFDGMTARYFMHHLDYLDGVVYTQRANKLHYQRALRKKKIFDRQNKREQKDIE